MFARFKRPRLSAHQASYAILAGILVQFLVVVIAGLFIWGTFPLWLNEPGEASLLWLLIPALLSVGAQVTLVLQEGGLKRKLGAVFLYTVVSLGIYYVVLIAGVIIGILVAVIGCGMR